MSQKKDILNHLIEKGTITPIEALNLYGCFRLGARIADLEADGYEFDRKWIAMNGKRFMQYSLKEEWIFTFGSGMPLAGYCVRIKGNYNEARAKMREKFGIRWAFQYSAKEWDAWKKDPQRAWFMEKEIPFEEASA